MTSDKDELEKALQENLRLRRELGAEASKASGGMAYRLGWVLYWVCVVLAILWVGFFVVMILGTWVFWGGNTPPHIPLDIWFRALIPPLLIYGLGRLLRYVLSGK